MYRPQFAYAGAAGKCDAQRCHYSYDGTNTPTLESIAAGALLSKIPLRMDQDAPFLLRGLQVNGAGALIRLEDCFGNPLLTDGTVVAPALWCASDGGPVAPLESDDWGIYCPSGGVLLLYVQNPTDSAITDLVVNLHGVKLYSEGACS